MPAKASRGGRIGVRSGDRGGTVTGGPVVGLEFHITGVEKATDDFKRIRRDINVALRDAMQRAGERTIVPAIRSRLPVKDSSTDRGQPPGTFAGSINIKRDRLDVAIRSTLPLKLDRALGWLDFGGRRPNDTVVRAGPRVIVTTLDEFAPMIDTAVYDEVMRQFSDFDISRT